MVTDGYDMKTELNKSWLEKVVPGDEANAEQTPRVPIKIVNCYLAVETLPASDLQA